MICLQTRNHRNNNLFWFVKILWDSFNKSWFLEFLDCSFLPNSWRGFFEILWDSFCLKAPIPNREAKFIWRAYRCISFPSSHACKKEKMKETTKTTKPDQRCRWCRRHQHLRLPPSSLIAPPSESHCSRIAVLPYHFKFKFKFTLAIGIVLVACSS